MFKHILVPVDFTPKNKKALEVTLQISGSEKVRVSLLHVVEIIEDATFDEFGDFYAGLQKRAEKKMAGLTAFCENHGAQVTDKIAFGNRVQEILKYAAETDVDLIVMSSHKLHLEEPSRDWGTISYKIGILSQCPVLLVK
ncbi:Nucleotide-binding universal stress protein, UspA family [Syntrophus gentianae]|uniref:Nucleotide-binding universal stress protein, UspA family n=1 Tax=Syntrophus gentianae TaxID=43775 RepID=A0A1H7Y5B7_9BACT|nr:universal stress protein [Syntrophus gentianae]SEM41416.1 Nucleotide-binding universal stress protein, UspA family [Syntrophus gentianae]